VLAVLSSGVAALVVSPGAEAATSGGSYVAVSPTRLLDTRTTTGGHHGAVPAGKTVSFAVTGLAGIPSAVSAVVLNITVTSPAAGGYITAYAYNATRPGVSNLNFVKGQTRPNLAVVPVASGKVTLYNGSSGSVQLIADVSGYFASGAPTGQGTFRAASPTRLLDTRTTTGGHHGAVGAGKTVSFAVSAPGASAVVLNVTATAGTSSGYITAYPGGSRPVTSTLNYTKGGTIPNLAVVPVGSDGKVTLYNGSAGTVQLIADEQGYLLGGDPTVTGALGALTASRVLDTRTGIGARKGAVGAHGTVSVSVFGRAGVPVRNVSAVVLNVTLTGPTTGGYLTVYSGSRPTVSNLNFVRGQTVANLVLARPSSSGTVTIYNGSSGTVQVFADVSGYARATTVTVPATSTSRYVRNISGAESDTTTMNTEGCTDATNRSAFVLLDIGAQLNNKTGVQLSATSTNLTYSQLVTAVQAYLDGYSRCNSAQTSAVVAVGTNNDGDFTSTSGYYATERGQDWARKVVEPLRAYATSKNYQRITVAGADDIEPGGSSNQAQAANWELYYLNGTTSPLYFVGSADGCPTSYGSSAACEFGWTQQQLYSLAYGSHINRIRALPQMYTPAQTAQWANIARTGGSAAGFVGSLTEYASCPVVQSGCSVASQTPAFGWAALYHAVSTVGTPTLSYATDLEIDD
jgi:hypothetical protein